ncbi:hypothetical protein NGM10_16735 (plasmid) [Halorussus salilacus]|uniref:hypothetical protein n=1 Tax=Halorussus salilacus TaxID=2953750 RepID=UPI00209FE303|nr:hypothetical protein [Halorussus salilacus]USZ69744.1 hypothetical protein NGM10_16735 [Halorussus salilacus]
MERPTRLKLLVAAGAASVATAITFVAADPYAPTYEISVYDSYGPAFWALLLAAVFLGQVVVFESGRSEDPHPYWKWGFALVVAASVVLLSIPALRYHLFARGDMLTYIGMIREIADLGTLPRNNYYPNVHLLALTLSDATGIDPSKVINVVPPVVSIFYVVSMYPLLTALFSDGRKALLVLPFASLPLFGFDHVFFHPSVVAFMLLPFVLALLFRSYGGRSRYRFKLLLLVAMVALVFYHPAVTVFVVGILVLLKLSFLVGRRTGEGFTGRETTSLTAASLGFVLFFSWYYSFESIIGSTLGVVYTLVGVSEGSSTFDNISGVFGRTSPDLVDVALTGIYTYGMVGAVVGMGLLFLSYYALLIVRDERRFDPVEAFLGATLVVFTVGGAIAFFVDVVLDFYRIVRYALFAGSVLIGIGFYTLFERVDCETASRNLRRLLYVSFVVFAFLSVFLLYGSPLANDSSSQITQAEVEGMDWLFEHRNRTLLIDQLGIDQYRMYNFHRSTEVWGENVRREVPPPPMHFDYRNASDEEVPSWAATDRRYLVATKLGRTKNPRFYPQYRDFWRHSPEDFERLERDPAVAHVYDDGTLDTYVVRDVGNRTNSSTTGTP